MDDQDFGESFFEKFRDFFGSRGSGRHWGGGATGTRPEPKRRTDPWAGINFGIQDVEEQARLACEQAILCSAARDLPQLEPASGTFTTLLHPVGGGWMTFVKGFYYSLGLMLEPVEWRNRSSLLRWQAWAGVEIMVCVPEGGLLTDKAKRDWSERRRIVANDCFGIYLDRPFTKAAVLELAASFFCPMR